MIKEEAVKYFEDEVRGRLRKGKDGYNEVVRNGQRKRESITKGGGGGSGSRKKRRRVTGDENQHYETLSFAASEGGKKGPVVCSGCKFLVGAGDF